MAVKLKISADGYFGLDPVWDLIHYVMFCCATWRWLMPGEQTSEQTSEQTRVKTLIYLTNQTRLFVLTASNSSIMNMFNEKQWRQKEKFRCEKNEFGCWWRAPAFGGVSSKDLKSCHYPSTHALVSKQQTRLIIGCNLIFLTKKINDGRTKWRETRFVILILALILMIMMMIVRVSHFYTFLS